MKTEFSLNKNIFSFEAMQNITFDTSSYVCLTVQTLFLLQNFFFFDNCFLSLGFKMQNHVI